MSLRPRACNLPIVAAFATFAMLLAMAAPAVAHAATLEVGPTRTYTTIAAALAAASAGDTIAVDAGVYKEYLVVRTPVALVGPNAGRVVGAPRSEEATIMPPDGVAPRESGFIATSTVHIVADDVTVDGFYLAGDNPDNATGVTMADGRTSEAGVGVSSGEAGSVFGEGVTTEGTTVRCNVIDGFPGYGTYFGKVLDNTTASWNHVVADNTIRNIRVATASYSGAYYPGICVYGIYSAYYSAERNILDGMRGTYLERFEEDDGRFPGLVPAVRENTVTANIWGITLNPQTNWGSPGRPYTIEGNRIDMSGGNIGWRPSVGVLFSAMEDYWGTPTAPTVRDNVLVGGDYGYYGVTISETMTAGPLTIEGGSVTGSRVGVILTNSSAWWGNAGWISSSRMVVDSVEISGCEIGVQADDPDALPDPWGGTNPDSLIPVRIDLIGTTRIHGCGLGAYALGVKARVHSELVATGCNTVPWRETTGTVTWTDVASPAAAISPPGGTYEGTVTVSMTATHPVGACPKVIYGMDGDPVETTYTAPVPLSLPGTYTITYFARDEWGHVSGEASATYVVVPEASAEVTRVGGPDRYAVAHNMALAAFPGWTGIDDVVIASGLDAAIADPLAAAGLAGVHDAPVLLVRGDVRKLPTWTQRALTSIAVANPGTIRVHIVGGTASVPNWIKTEISKISSRFVYDRAGGLDRYEVAANVGYAMRAKLSSVGATVPGVFIANGRDAARYYDPLALGPIAYGRHMPILLVHPTYTPRATTLAVASLAPTATNRYIGGPTVAVGSPLAGFFNVPAGNRLYDPADSSRYGTARAVAEYARARDWLAYDEVGVTNKIADALTSGSGLGRFGGPVLYTETNKLSSKTSGFLTANKAAIDRVWVVGGPASVSDGVFASIVAALE